MDETGIWRWIAGSLFTLWSAALSVMGATVLGRIKKVEDEKADKSDVDDIKQGLRDLTVTIKEDRDNASTKRGEMYNELRKYNKERHARDLQLTELLATLKGRLNGEHK